MPTNLLDRVQLRPLYAKPYARVFEPAWGDVLSVHPDAPGRFALKDGMPAHATRAGCWYISDTLAGALWESVLRNVEPDNDSGVYLDLPKLARSSVQWVEPVGSGEVLRLEPAERRHVVLPSNKLLNRYWDELIGHEIYELTHAAAGLVQLQCLAGGVVLPGISWRSRQANADIVYVLYEPPRIDTGWMPVGDPIQLDRPAGQQLLRETLAASGMFWLNDPIRAGTPPAGAI